MKHLPEATTMMTRRVRPAMQENGLLPSIQK